MRKLGVALGVIAVVASACSSPAATPPSSPPIVFESGAAAVPCLSGLTCFPIADLQHDVITPLTAAGYTCIPQAEGTGAICKPKNAEFYLEIDRQSVHVKSTTLLGVRPVPDADTLVAQITIGLRAVLPVLLPKFPGAQQFFQQQLRAAATQPNACTGKSVGHGYGIICLGRPAPAGAHTANAVVDFGVHTTSDH